jgi:hypothetical protein
LYSGDLVPGLESIAQDMTQYDVYQKCEDVCRDIWALEGDENAIRASR